MWLELVFKPWYSERRLVFWCACLLACMFGVILRSSFLAVSTNRRTVIGNTSLLDLKLTYRGLYFIQQTYEYTRSIFHIASSDWKCSSSWKEKRGYWDYPNLWLASSYEIQKTWHNAYKQTKKSSNMQIFFKNSSLRKVWQ